MVWVKIQAYDMNGASTPRYGDFYAIDEANMLTCGFGACFGETACVVVVGECEHRAAVLCGKLYDLGGRECAIRNGGMAM